MKRALLSTLAVIAVVVLHIADFIWDAVLPVYGALYLLGVVK